jgi:hypothetical protein
MSVLPSNDEERKNLPIFKMVCNYFPKALREVTRVCVANNVRYNPDRKPADINWARGKSNDQLGSLFRHILESAADGLVFEDLPPEVQAACGPGFEHVYVLAEAAWRALAALELQIEEQEAQVAVPTGTEIDSQLMMEACAFGSLYPRDFCPCPGCTQWRGRQHVKTGGANI